MRILIFHGYLLGGTGSNVYNARLTRTLVSLGHEVHLLTQDRHPEDHDFVDEVATWSEGRLTVTPCPTAPQDGSGPADCHVGRGRRRGVRRTTSKGGGRCVVYRPDIGELLPVYVEDPYEGIEARAFPRCTEAEVDTYIRANVDAVSEVLDRVRPEIALANHLIMGPVILARALGSDHRVPYVVKIHGSALEYTVKPHPDRFLAFALEGLSTARAVLVGSGHTARSLRELISDATISDRIFLGPPGVDVERFTPVEEHRRGRLPVVRSGKRPYPTGTAPERSGVVGEISPLVTTPSLQQGTAPERSGVVGEGSEGPVVAFVGKLIVNKGIDLLVAAWPLVLQGVPGATLAVIGFGPLQDAILSLIDALADGDIDRVRALALAGRTLEDPRDQGPGTGGGSGTGGGMRAGIQTTTGARSLKLILAFLDGLQGADLDRYLAAAKTVRERVVMVGRLEHPELTRVLPWCEAIVVPSTFPEAFGMVAVEGAACGAFPITASHSGLAEVSQTLAEAVGARAAGWLSFEVDTNAVSSLAGCIHGWLSAEPDLRTRTRERLVREVGDRWSWEGVARTVITAARGDFDQLTRPTRAEARRLRGGSA